MKDRDISHDSLRTAHSPESFTIMYSYGDASEVITLARWEALKLHFELINYLDIPDRGTHPYTASELSRIGVKRDE